MIKILQNVEKIIENALRGCVCVTIYIMQKK